MAAEELADAAETFGAPVATVVNNALIDFPFDGDASKAALLSLTRSLTKNLVVDGGPVMDQHPTPSRWRRPLRSE